MMIYKIYEICRRRMMSLRRKFLTRCANNVHKEKISKQGLIIRPQYGRSMVEMLGVLAIVGVLSVGGIAGYSKAMMKYKLNKQASQLNQILSAMYRYKDEWKFNDWTPLKNYYIKLGEIPKEMIKDNSNYIYDVFDNKMIMRNNNAPKYDTVVLQISMLGNKDFSICQNIMRVAKEHSSNIGDFSIWYQEGESTSDNHGNFFRGDNYVNSKDKVLRNMTLDDMKEQCQICANSNVTRSCRFVFAWYINF